VPASKIGREWRFSRRALVEWLSSGDSQIYSSSDSEAREFFNRVAPEWEDLRRGYYDESVISRLTDMKLLKEDMTVLDLGAGDGYLSRAVAGAVKRVIAVDISGEMLRTLAKKAAEKGVPNIETLEGDACDMPVPDSSVDLLCANMFLHHIEEPGLAIKEMKRVLKPGGKVFLADLREHSNSELKERMHDVWLGFSPEEVMEWFGKCGFKDIRLDPAPEVKKGAKNRSEENIFIMTAVKA